MVMLTILLVALCTGVSGFAAGPLAQRAHVRLKAITDSDLEKALDAAAQAKMEAHHARAKADELAAFPFFKKSEEGARQQRMKDANEWAETAKRLEAAAEEARAAAESTLEIINEQEAAEAAEAEEALRKELGDAYEEPAPPVVDSFNGSEDRGGDINGIVAITLPTVVACLALPALADWFNH